MFYYPDVLLRHTGCFSTIWLAATRGIRVTRREFLRVNVNQTCGDILDYVTAQVPAPLPNQPRPRFSLYLSSQLQYGVVVVYHRQCGYLLEEIQQTIDRLLRSKKCIRIDMAESDRLALDVPDCLNMMEAAEGAQDPFFGLMESFKLPSPFKLHQPVLMTEEAGSQHSLVPSLHSTVDTEGFRSPPAAITLTEKEHLLIPAAAECFVGDDLPEITAREIDFLMEQPDQFLKEVERQAEERPRELEAVTSIDQLRETALGTEQDSVWLFDEETGQPVKVPLAAVALEMTPTRVALPTPPFGASEKEGDGAMGSPYVEVGGPPLKKTRGRRRRQLVFADSEVQISDGAFREQIGNPQTGTLTLSEVLLDLASLTYHATPAQLFSAPCRPIIHADLLSLWKQSASLVVLPGQGKKERGEEEEERGESEQDREIVRMERKRRQSSMRELSSESGPRHTDSSSVMLDMSKEGRSVSDVITPVSRWSPREEAQLPMEPIAEENIEMPEAQCDAESRDMLSWISSSVLRCGEVTFDSLLPPEAHRSTAAHTLFKLLELLSAGHVTVRQTEAYSHITIKPAGIRMTA